jgi:FG-GAP-like repeat
MSTGSSSASSTGTSTAGASSTGSSTGTSSGGGPSTTGTSTGIPPLAFVTKSYDFGIVHYPGTFDPGFAMTTRSRSDGFVDLVFEPGLLIVLEGNGDGTFVVDPSVPYVDTYGVISADFNLDGEGDLVADVDQTSSLSLGILLANGPRAFVTGYLADVTWGAVIAEDLNGDGKPDVVADFNSLAEVAFGNGDGGFGPFVGYPCGQGSAFLSDDFDRKDGPDLVCADTDALMMTILLNDGGGAFTESTQMSLSSSELDFGATGDLDGRNGPDIVTLANRPATLDIFLNNGDGGFTEQPLLSLGIYYCRSFVLVDLNGDGKLDLAVAAYFEDSVEVLLGNGDGTFQRPIFFPVAGNPFPIVTADFNRDGLPDLATANETDGGAVFFSVLLNSR